MPQEDSQAKWLVAEDNEDKVKHILMLKLQFGLLKLDESVLDKHGFVLPFPFFTQMHKVDVEGWVVLIEVRVPFLCGHEFLVKVVNALQASKALGKQMFDDGK